MINVKGTISKAHIASIAFYLDDAKAALRAYLEARRQAGEVITDSSPVAEPLKTTLPSALETEIESTILPRAKEKATSDERRHKRRLQFATR